LSSIKAGKNETAVGKASVSANATSVGMPFPLVGLDLESAANLIAVAADIALVLDGEGVVRGINCNSEEMSREGFQAWVGRPLVDTVSSPASRTKITALLQEAAGGRSAKWRQVNHVSLSGSGDVPVLYAAFKADADGRIIAFGRDLRAVAALQQRLVDAQHSMERDYWRLRYAETRYRLLFQMSYEAIVVIDAATQKVIEANTSVAKLLGKPAGSFVGHRFPDGFDEASTQSIDALFAQVRTAGRADDIRVRLAEPAAGSSVFTLSASLFRQDQSAHFLVRFSPIKAELPDEPVARSILGVVENASDGFVVCDMDGLILSANRAFVDMAQLNGYEQARGAPLDRWLGHSGVDFSVLMANLRQRGAVRLFATGLRGQDGSVTDVEVSAVSVPQGDAPCLGFTIRNLGGRVIGHVGGGSPAGTAGHAAGPGSAGITIASVRGTPRSVEQLTELVGRVPMKELVGETTDLIEKLCIEAALKLTSDNRAAAAEMLGLSRQSLYVKLRRYGLGDLPPEGEEND
jgi:transcriptional regulator PpsR